MQNPKPKIIISGGGTGGHIFPAISIANAIKSKRPGAEILFVGALGRMEMEKVPAAGYTIIGLPISGIQRRLTYKNIVFIFNLLKSLKMAKSIILSFKPDIAIGVGGYASGPILKAANRKGIPTLLQEQNSYAGITNRLLANKAEKICVAYQDMKKYFPEDKIILTGNPVRSNILSKGIDTSEARNFFKIENDYPVILIIGGSLGARTINRAIEYGVSTFDEKKLTVIWQTGKYYYKKAVNAVKSLDILNIRVLEFITRMDYAYHLANIVVSRAGAGTISELCLLKKPAILVPSPNVSEDHQTKNAMALVKENAALLVKDIDAGSQLVNTIMQLVEDKRKQIELSANIEKLALHNSDERIADEIFKIIDKE